MNTIDALYEYQREVKRLKHVLSGMRNRCYNPNATGYENYGGRGISVCDRWMGKKGFDNFLNDIIEIGLRPTSDYTIDRINNDGDYTPENIRWADRRTQILNQRVVRVGKSGYRGVVRNGEGWVASIGYGGKNHHLGRFDNPEDAARAYNEAAYKHHGEYAKPNIIPKKS